MFTMETRFKQRCMRNENMFTMETRFKQRCMRN